MNPNAMNPNDWLAEFMGAHGVRGEHHDDWVIFPDHGKRGYARLFPREPVWQLDIGIEIYPGWLVLESFAGTGEDADEALKDAFEAFARGVLHVMLSAFFSVNTGEQVTREQWDIAGTPRQVTIGSVVFRGPVPADFAEAAFFPQFEAALKSSSLSEGTHWLRLNYAQQDGRAVLHEAMLDNEPWPEMQEAMTRFVWPSVTSGFSSLRLFLVIQGGVGIAEACDAICRKAENGDPVLEMIAMGATRRQAAMLYSLVKLAFGRYVIDRLGVTPSDEFLLCELNGRQTRHALASEPIFIEATALAQSRRQLSEDQFAQIAARSIEVMGVNDKLCRGAKVAGLTLPPPVIFVFEEDPPSIFRRLARVARGVTAKMTGAIRSRPGDPPAE